MSNFLLTPVIQFFENVVLSAHSENFILCSHYHTSNVSSLYFIAKKFSMLNFLQCFLRSFQLSYQLCKGGYIWDFHCVLASRQLKKKSHHHLACIAGRIVRVQGKILAAKCEYRWRSSNDILPAAQVNHHRKQKITLSL